MTDDTVIIKRHAEKPRAEPAQSFPVVLETGLRQIGKPALPQNARKTGKAPYVTFNDPAGTIAVKADIKTFFSPHRHSAAYGAIRARDGQGFFAQALSSNRRILELFNNCGLFQKSGKF